VIGGLTLAQYLLCFLALALNLCIVTT